MFEKINNYIVDKEFHITIYENQIHIMNYKKIMVLEEDKMVLLSNRKIINIEGNSIKLEKLLDNEMLCSGIIERIEMKDA